MATRIISAAVALVVAVIVLLLSKTIVFYIAISAISGLIIYELFHAKKLLEFKTSFFTCLVFSIGLPFLYISHINSYIPLFVFGLAIILFITFLLQHKKLSFDNVCFMIATTVLVSVAMCSLIKIKNTDSRFGIFYFCITLASAWVADAGAYFVGTFFGKHKLCPEISPKKTIEGAIGGIFVNCIVLCLAAFIYSIVMKNKGINIEVNYVLFLIYGVVTSIISIIGDLVASLLKRQCEIKDYGNIMPGHGGMLDRFDSVLFVAPFTSLLLSFMQFLK